MIGSKKESTVRREPFKAGEWGSKVVEVKRNLDTFVSCLMVLRMEDYYWFNLASFTQKPDIK